MLGFLEFSFSVSSNQMPQTSVALGGRRQQDATPANRFLPSQRSIIAARSPGRPKTPPSTGERHGRGKIVGRDGEPGSASTLQMLDGTRRNGEKEKRRIPRCLSRISMACKLRWGSGPVVQSACLPQWRQRRCPSPSACLRVGESDTNTTRETSAEMWVMSARKYLGERLSQAGKENAPKKNFALL